MRTLQLRAASTKKRDEWLTTVQGFVQAVRDADYATAIAHGEEGAQHWQEKVVPAVWRGEQQVRVCVCVCVCVCVSVWPHVMTVMYACIRTYMHAYCVYAGLCVR